MALATQCPHCYTSFRVANDQLKLHAGMVRCGACKQTFNGIEHLLAPGATPKSPPSQTSDTGNAAATLAVTQSTPQNTTQNTASATEVETDAAPVASENLASHAASHIEEAGDLSAVDFKSPIDDQIVDAYESESISEKSQALAPQIDISEASNEDSATEANLEAQSLAEGDKLTTQIEIGQNNTHEPQQLDSALIDSLPETSEQILPEVNANLAEEKANLGANLDVNLGANLGANLVANLVANLSDGDAVNPEQEIVASDADATEVEITNPATTNLATTNAVDTQTAPQLSENDNNEIEVVAEAKKRRNKPGALTASLDFELSKEDQAWADEIAQVNQLELETRAAVLDETSEAWSKHEPQLAQDGFIDSLKNLKPIFDDIGDFGSIKHQSSASSDEPLHTLDDLRVHGTKADSLSDQDLNLDVDTKDDDVTPAFVLQAERAQRFGKWKKIGLNVAAFIFVLVGVAQSIYFLRSDIAAQLPQFKPQLLSICKVLSCQIKLPAQRSMLEITGSELLIVNEELSMNTLSVQIQNKSSTLQAWPHFDLTLKDKRGKDLLQKAFTPAQYLENKDLLNKGMAANSESNHKVFFQLNGLKASDYTVEIFYP